MHHFESISNFQEWTVPVYFDVLLNIIDESTSERENISHIASYCKLKQETKRIIKLARFACQFAR